MIYTLKPVFIFGCDRSGTTMLGDMLGSHNDAIVTPESQFFHELLLLIHNKVFRSRDEVVDWLITNFRFAVWDMKYERDELIELVDLDNPRVMIESIIHYYIKQRQPDKRKSLMWVDHTPDNMRYYAILKKYFPEAKFIHLARDGRAVFNSIKRLNWGPNNAYTGSRFWSERLREAMQVEISEGDNCIRLHYEDIVKNPDVILKQTCQFLNISYSDKLMLGGGLMLPEFTQGQHDLVGKKPDQSRLYDWQNKLSKKEIIEFESYEWSRYYLRSLGYPLITDSIHNMSMFGVLLRYCHEGFMYSLHRIKHRAMEKSTVKCYVSDSDGGRF